MKWFILLTFCIVVLAQNKTLEEKIYLPRCNGSWFIENQGSDDSADWVVMHCNDYSDEDTRNN